MNSCNCLSYNRHTGTPKEAGKDKPVLLNPLDYFPFEGDVKNVAIDKCIAPVIVELWNNKIWTINSCCGHGGEVCEGMPSIIFDHPLTKEEAENIRSIISKIDNREFILQAWKLTIF